MVNEVKSRQVGHIAILITNIVFGVSIPIVKSALGYPGMNANTLSFCRFLGAMLLFWGVSPFLKKEKVPVRDLGVIALASVFGIVMNQWVFMNGLSYASPFDVSLILTMGPILTLILSFFFLREPITGLKMLGVGLGAVGAVWLALFSQDTGGESGVSRVLGLVLCSASVTSYAFYLTFFKRVIDKYSAVTLMKWMFTFSSFISLPFCLGDFLHSPIVQGAAMSLYWQVLYVVVAVTFLPYFLLPIAQQRIRPTIVSMYNYAQPVLTAIVSILIGLDTWQWGRLPSVFLIFIGVYLVTQSRSRQDGIKGTHSTSGQ